MRIKANSPEEYIAQLPEDRKIALTRLREIINRSIPEGFVEEMSYGFIGWVVPHSMYPGGYHVDPKVPLPFLSIASQKSFVAVYHMGIYTSPELLKWFTDEYPNHVKTKLDMGKSCIRFKKMETIPYDLLEELFTKMTPQEWISLYEDQIKR